MKAIMTKQTDKIVSATKTSCTENHITTQNDDKQEFGRFKV